MEKLPTVSIIVCTLNREKLLSRALDSLLNLNYPKEKLEIIVVDNNSTDNTADTARAYRIKYVFEGKKGIANARNAGIRAASNEIIVFTDDDCKMDGNWIRELIVGFREPNTMAAAGKILSFPHPNLIQQYTEMRGLIDNSKHLTPEGPFPGTAMGANMAFHKKIFDKIGLYDERFCSGADDVEMSWRLQFAGYRIAFVPTAIIWHEHRRTLTGMLKQAFNYGWYLPLVVKKYRNKLGGTFFVSWKNLAWVPFNLVLLVPMLVIGRNWVERLTPALNILKHVTFLSGEVLGCIKWGIVAI